jgi:hypothetical protein
MKIISVKPSRQMQQDDGLLEATPTVGNALMISGFSLIVGLAILGFLGSRLAAGQTFSVDEAVFGLISLVLLVAAYFLGRRIPGAVRLERQGRRVKGKILAAWQDQDSDDDAVYYLSFSAGSHSFRQRVKRSRFLAYQAGDQVDIIQCEDEPELARLAF